MQELAVNAENLNEWELRTLILTVQDKIPLEAGELTRKLQVKLYLNSGSKWNTDPKYKELATPLARARMHPKGAIALHEDDYISFKEIKPMLQAAHRMNRRQG